MSQPAREQSTRLQDLRTDSAHSQVLPKLAAPTNVGTLHPPTQHLGGEGLSEAKELGAIGISAPLGTYTSLG
jgi:hypothetical protein